MATDDISNTIEALKQVSSRIQAEDQQTVDNINALIDRLENELAHEQYLSIGEQVATMVESTEARHPKLTLLLNDLMVKLASMGV